MNTKKYLKLILLCILTFLFMENNIYGQDDFPDYIFQLINKIELKSEEGYDLNKNFFYETSASFFFELGDYKKAFEILKKIDDEYVIYNSLINFMESLDFSNKEIITFFENKINNFRDFNLKIISLISFLNYFIKKNETNKVLEILAKLYEIGRETRNTENQIDFLYCIVDVVSPLYKKGFLKDAEKILLSIEQNVLKTKDFRLVEILIDKFIQFENKNKIKEWIDFYKKNISDDIEERIRLGKILVKLERYDEALKIFKDIFLYFKVKQNNQKGIETLAGILHTNFILEDNIIVGLISKSKLITNVLKDCFIFKENEDIEKGNYYFAGMNDRLIEFLVKIGEYKEAFQIAEKIDILNHYNKYKDLFYYNIISINSDLENSCLLSKKIINNCFLIQSLITIANKYKTFNEENKFVELLNEAVSLIKVVRCPFFFGRIEDLAMAWLEGGYPEKALEIIRKEKNEHVKSKIIFEIAQMYIENFNLECSKKLILELNEKYQHLIESKVAARILINGSEKEGIEIFKKVCKKMVESNNQFFSTLLRDYINVKKYNKFVKTKLWRQVPVVN